MEVLIESLGYLGAYLGAMLEGEILFLTVVQTVRMGYLHFYPAMAAIFLGALTSDWLFFLIGRRRGRSYLARKPKVRVKIDQMNAVFEQQSLPLLLGYRFLYGFRTILPLLFGLSTVPLRLFIICSLVSTTLWVLLIGWLGYYFTGWLQNAITFVQSHGLLLLLLLPVVLAFLGWRYHRSGK